MLPIKEHFAKLIKQGEKTVELRKTWNLKEILQNSIELEEDDFKTEAYIDNLEMNGRINIGLDNEQGKYLGTITINGYEIIKNPFNQITKEYKEKMTSIIPKQFLNWNEYDWKKWTIESYFDDRNRKWILDNWDWLCDYFKDEPEILVLKIESWESVNE